MGFGYEYVLVGAGAGVALKADVFHTGVAMGDDLLPPRGAGSGGTAVRGAEEAFEELEPVDVKVGVDGGVAGGGFDEVTRDGNGIRTGPAGEGVDDVPMEGFGEIFGEVVDDIKGFAVDFIPGVIFGEKRVAADAGTADFSIDDLAETAFCLAGEPVGNGVCRDREDAADPSSGLTEFDLEDRTLNWATAFRNSWRTLAGAVVRTSWAAVRTSGSP